MSDMLPFEPLLANGRANPSPFKTPFSSGGNIAAELLAG
jgi:hypothetical protein